MKSTKLSAAIVVTAGLLTGASHSVRSGPYAAEVAAAKENAAAIYDAAIAAVRVASPAGSNAEFRSFPPYGEEWNKSAVASFEQNQAALKLVHDARKSDHATWTKDQAELLKKLNSIRNLANIIGDAALLQHSRGDDVAAFETLRDLDHLALMLRQDLGDTDHVRALVSIGIDVFTSYRTMVISADLRLTDDAKDAKHFTVAAANAFIKDLLAMPAAETMAEKLFVVDAGPAIVDEKQTDESGRARAIEQGRRTDAERGMTAMSLACKVFHKQSGRWPATLEELATKLPKLPLDPWGDGKQTLGYTLVKHGLPSGEDRPLVYSRCDAKDGLAFRVDEPQFGFYSSDGSDRPRSEQKRIGQFRDVTLWQPKSLAGGESTTRPLQ